MGLQSGEGRRANASPLTPQTRPPQSAARSLGGTPLRSGVRSWRVSRGPRVGYKNSRRASRAAGVTPLGCQPRSDLRSRPWVLDASSARRARARPASAGCSTRWTPRKKSRAASPPLPPPPLRRPPPWSWRRGWTAEGVRPGLAGGRLPRCAGGGHSPRPGGSRRRGAVVETSGGRAPRYDPSRRSVWRKAPGPLGKIASNLTPLPVGSLIAPPGLPLRISPGHTAPRCTRSETVSAGTRRPWGSLGGVCGPAGGCGWGARWPSSSAMDDVTTAGWCDAGRCGAARAARRRSGRSGPGRCSARWPGMSTPAPASRGRSS